MKQCLGYWNRLAGAGKYALLAWMLWSVVWPDAGLLILGCIYDINALSLNMFSDQRKKGGHVLTLTLPLSRRTLWDTRMWGVTVVYLLYGSLLCIRTANGFDNMLILNFLLFGHAACGVCLRKREWYLLSGLPGLIILFLLLSCIWWKPMEGLLNSIENSPFFLKGLGVVNVGLLVWDLYVWAGERRLFIEGVDEYEKNDGLSETA